MKRFSLLPIALAVSLTLTACAGSSSSSSSDSSSSSSTSGSQSETVKVDYSLGLDDNGHYSGITALDYVTLPDGYDAITIPEEYATLSDETLQNSLDNFMSQYATDEQLTDRAVADGDVVNIDYVGYIDGEAFAGGDTQGAGADYTAGSNELIDDFLTQIIGVMPGETIDVVVTFPDPYQNNEELSGKEATFVTTVNYIHGESIVPELTDEFVAEKLSSTYNISTVQQLRDQLSQGLLSQQRSQYVQQWFFDNCKIDQVPQQLIDNQCTIMRQELAYTSQLYGMDEDTLATQYGAESADALIEQYKTQMEKSISQYLAIQAVAEAKDLAITEDDISAYFSASGVTDYSSYVNQYGTGYVYQAVMANSVVQMLLDNAQDA